MKSIFFSILIIAVIGSLGYVFIKPLNHSPKGKISIVMAGQSTMKLWFKHWNWPYPLRLKTTYKNWPIGYQKYSKDNVYYEYYRLAGPRSKDPLKPFGQDMVTTFVAVLESNKFDAAFFKFCFLDFIIDEEKAQKRYGDLIRVVEEVAEAAGKRGVKLIVGNALPLPTPSEPTVKLQERFNAWLTEFAAKHDDVIVYDLYTPLIDDSGRLRDGLSRGDGDPHLHDKAYSILDKSLFSSVGDWLKKSNPR